MFCNIRYFSASIILIAFICTFTRPASADCTSPNGIEGAQLYNFDYKAMQFCDGTTWWGMKGGGGGLPTCVDGESIVSSSGSWVCDGGGGGGGGGGSDTTPFPFDFVDQDTVARSTVIESNIVQITGIDTSTTIQVSGGDTPEFRICTDGSSDGACDASEVQTWTGVDETIENSQYLQIRMTSNAAYFIEDTVAISVGTENDQWNVATTATYYYTSWGNWGSCSGTCDTSGNQNRSRSCKRTQDNVTVSCTFCGNNCSQSQGCGNWGCGDGDESHDDLQWLYDSGLMVKRLIECNKEEDFLIN